MSARLFRPRARRGEEGEQWLSVADLMSGLMIVFLFLAIIYLQPLAQKATELEQANTGLEQANQGLAAARERIREIVVAFSEDESRLAVDLERELARDLPRWGAELDRPTLTIRFRAPDLLFEQGQARLRPEFRRVLEEFLPRYLAILHRHRDGIEEVRIEGHTSSEWAPGVSATDAFFRNMELSQARTRAVLEVVLTARGLEGFRDWARSTVTANGLASARPVTRAGAPGAEDPERSRRVEFRTVTRARERVMRVLEEVR
jgi:outer membrane protein OmpA-like peptidoglycan-associated protein